MCGAHCSGLRVARVRSGCGTAEIFTQSDDPAPQGLQDPHGAAHAMASCSTPPVGQACAYLPRPVWTRSVSCLMPGGRWWDCGRRALARVASRRGWSPACWVTRVADCRGPGALCSAPLRSAASAVAPCRHHTVIHHAGPGPSPLCCARCLSLACSLPLVRYSSKLAWICFHSILRCYTQKCLWRGALTARRSEGSVTGSRQSLSPHFARCYPHRP